MCCVCVCLWLVAWRRPEPESPLSTRNRIVSIELPEHRNRPHRNRPSIPILACDIIPVTCQCASVSVGDQQKPTRSLAHRTRHTERRREHAVPRCHAAISHQPSMSPFTSSPSCHSCPPSVGCWKRATSNTPRVIWWVSASCQFFQAPRAIRPRAAS